MYYSILGYCCCLLLLSGQILHHVTSAASHETEITVHLSPPLPVLYLVAFKALTYGLTVIFNGLRDWKHKMDLMTCYGPHRLPDLGGFIVFIGHVYCKYDNISKRKINILYYICDFINRIAP